MVRIHLAQILYQPSYYQPPVDWLEEPCYSSQPYPAIGQMRSNDEIQNFLLDSKSAYVEHVRSKLTEIAEWSGEKGAHVLAFPEYSVPFQVLQELQELAKRYSMLIVAGTHRIPSGEEPRTIYTSLGLTDKSVVVGSAYSFLLCPDGSVQTVAKTSRSKWEPDLKVPTADPTVLEVACGDTVLRIGVLPCIDCLHPDILGKLMPYSPNLVICPSLSPETGSFGDVASVLSLHDIPFGYVNSASYGGTCFHIPSAWEQYLSGPAYPIKALTKGVEAILETELSVGGFYLKKGSVEQEPMCSHPWPFPLVYSTRAHWLNSFEPLGDDLAKWLDESGREDAIEYLDMYLAEQGNFLPDLLKQNLRYLRHSLLPLYDGNVQTLSMPMQIAKLADGIEDTYDFWARRVAAAISLLSTLIGDAPIDSMDVLLGCIKSLKEQQRILPTISTIGDEERDEVSVLLENTAFTGDTDLIEAFQNRGSDLDAIRDIFDNPEHKAIVITGQIGIGKSAFVNWMFRKAFSDWECIRVPISSGVRATRLLADIAFRIGMPLDVDFLGGASQNVFRQRVHAVLKKFYAHKKRVLILDDLQQVLAEGNMRDYRQLDTLMEIAGNPLDFQGGRIIIISTAWLPEKWLKSKGVAHLHLKRLNDKFVRRIVEFNMRQTEMLDGESMPRLPENLIGMISGNPLVARLMVGSVEGKSLDELSDELTISEITSRVAQELLAHVTLSAQEQELMRRLSVFRTPVRLETLLNIEGFRGMRDQLLNLARRSILSWDGLSLEMHDVVRRFCLKQVDDKDTKIGYHRSAGQYYSSIYYPQRASRYNDPTVMAELVHHWTVSGDISQANDIKLILVDEIKPSARTIYQELRDYEKALDLYKLLADVVPDDVEVEAYIGRCYARLQQWTESDSAFQRAADIAERSGKPRWWIYRDWGQIKARFGYYDDAQALLNLAAQENPRDPSIKATLGYMHWKNGYIGKAEGCFEEAHVLDPAHRYTLAYYSKFLDENGQPEYAQRLRDILDELEYGIRFNEPPEFDLEADEDDL